ncbi:MAG: serine protease [Chitinophagales bacterium]|nr:serine protease [Chitinophagales bacterium]
MTKYIVVLIWMQALMLPAFAQFKPALAEKSLVKVMVTGGSKMGVCSGFMWKKKSWVVTSLHAMKVGGKVQVVYPGNNIREASVIKVYQPGDLVLLETNITADPVSDELIPLTSYHQGEVAFAEKIYAIGFNGGSKGDQTQALEKGHANPETLEFLVRPEDKTQLSTLGFPSMKLPIYFLSGSLLPGFSGAPVFNMKNELIGIGDGGLERGLMNVSWCIPAANLDALEASAVSQLPANLGNASQLYTAEVLIDVKQSDVTPVSPNNSAGNDDPATNNNLYAAAPVDDYNSFSYGNFDFFQTKTRSLKEMQQTAIDPQNMESFAADFEENNLHIDYDVLEFDIYQDIRNGFMLALPSGTMLSYDADYDLFSVDLRNFPDGEYFDLYYYMVQHEGNPVGEVVDNINENFGADVHGLTIDSRYTKAYQLNDEWRIDYLLLNGNQEYNDEDLGPVTTSFYLNVISNEKVVFYSLAICYVPTSRNDINTAYQKGIDCVSNYDASANTCDYFESLMQIIAAAHLTTLASIY